MKNIVFFIIVSVSLFSCKSNNDEQTDANEMSDIIVDFNNELSDIDPNYLGVCPMFWTESDAVMSDGKIENYLKDMNCSFLRFPGGTESDNFWWPTNDLHDYRRWPYKGGQDKMDTDEFISLCRKLNAEPIICVNTEIAAIERDDNKAAQLAADWVRYCNIEKGYNVRYWEIGNEPYYHYRFTSTEYAQLFVKIVKAMKKVDPSILVAAVGEYNPEYVGVKDQVSPGNRLKAMEMEWEMEVNGSYTKEQIRKLHDYKDGKVWWPEVLKVAGDFIDVVSIHWYYGDNQLSTMSDLLKSFNALIKQNIKDHKVEMIMTEWSLHEGVKMYGMERALTVAEAIGRCIDGGLTKTTYWPLRCGGDHEKKGLIDSSDSNTTHANYDVMKLFGCNLGNKRIESLGKVTRLYHFATKNEKSLQLFLVNRNNETVTNKIEFKNLKSCEGKLFILDSKGDRNTEKPELYESTISYNGENLDINLPSYSMCVCIFPL